MIMQCVHFFPIPILKILTILSNRNPIVCFVVISSGARGATGEALVVPGRVRYCIMFELRPNKKCLINFLQNINKP